MNQIKCDCCQKDISEKLDGHGCWRIEIRFLSWWNPSGDVRQIDLCSLCGSKAARLLGFCYDTGKILSIARQEQIDDVTVFGPHGSGLADIALGGISGANPAVWHAEKPDEPIMGAMGGTK